MTSGAFTLKLKDDINGEELENFLNSPEFKERVERHIEEIESGKVVFMDGDCDIHGHWRSPLNHSDDEFQSIMECPHCFLERERKEA